MLVYRISCNTTNTIAKVSPGYHLFCLKETSDLLVHMRRNPAQLLIIMAYLVGLKRHFWVMKFDFLIKMGKISINKFKNFEIITAATLVLLLKVNCLYRVFS